MADREVFVKNLNYFLRKSGKLQKDLAEYVGAKTTTVSGWTRGVSYPRAEAMEKIAMFFRIPTSRLIQEYDEEDEDPNPETVPKTYEARSIAKGIDKMPEEQRKAFMDMLIKLRPDIFGGGTDDVT